MELAIIQDKTNVPSMTDITMAICGAMLLTYIHAQSIFKPDDADNKPLIDDDDVITTTTTTTTTTVTETVVTTETVPVKRYRPKVAPQKVETDLPETDTVASETEDPDTPEKHKNYLSNILKDNEDITIIIHLLDNKTMNCSAKYTNERIKITKCDFIPSLVGAPFHTPRKLQYRVISLLQKTKYKPAPAQNIWAQMFVKRNDQMVSLSSLK
jgi:hypothetical protein